MNESLLTYSPIMGLTMTLFTTAVAVFAAFAVLRVFDKLGGWNFGTHFFPVLMQDPKALSFYLAVRFAVVFAFFAYKLGGFI